MCGIFGYIGNKTNSADLVLDGLKLLEYRGYDSWGIAVKTGKKIAVEKHIGKIGNATISLPQSFLGIGQTRWATHGGVTEANAHPHLDCHGDIALVHNGIVENYLEIKEELQQIGHTFRSETDTEVIVHLIEENLKSKGFATSVREAFNSLRGLNAIVVAYAPSGEIIAAKTGSPLVVGEGEGEFYIASDISGIIKHTKKVLFMKDNEMVILGKELQLLSLPGGEKIEAAFETVEWNIEDVSVGSYDHFMMKEIMEQPTVIQNIAENYKEQIQELSEVVQKAHGTFFIGAGTAYNACLASTYLFSKMVHKHVNTAFASEFMYLEDFLTEKSLVIALSQSGETIDVIEPLNVAKKKGSTVVGIVNSLGSTIYRMADYKILLGAGPEKAVASTKAYIAKLSIMLLLSYASSQRLEEGIEVLKNVSVEITRLLQPEKIDEMRQLAKTLSKSGHIYAIGRGMSYATALEAALKIKEISYIPTEGFAGGELKHGTIALITQGTPCIVFLPNDETYESMISNAMEIRARGGVIIGVSHKKLEGFDHFIQVNDMKEGSLLSQIIPIQLLAYYLALEKGNDPDKPRNLAKSVTVK